MSHPTPRPLAELTPTEIDTRLADIDRRLFIADQTAAHTAARAARLRGYLTDGGHTRVTAKQVRDADAAAFHAAVAVDALHAEATPLHAEYDRRPWARTWIVLNTGGHAHNGTGYRAYPNCSTCFPTTRYGWLPQLAAATETQILAAIGDTACTVCYPSQKIVGAPRTAFSAEEIEAAAAHAEAVAAKAAQRAAKAAKAIANPDGTPLRDRSGYEVKTEQTAQNSYVADLTYAAGLDIHAEQARTEGDHNHAAHLDSLAAGYRDHCEVYLTALAAKRGTTVEAQREALAAKVAAKIRRDQREAEKTSRRLGLG